MKRNKILIFILVLFVIISYTDSNVLAADTDAIGACVMDASTNRVLFSKNADKKLPMASTTKIMTAILAIEHGSLTDVVTVSANASGVEGSSIYLEEGEQLLLEDLLYGLMLASGNDAAVAIAEHIGGNVDAFIEMMNAKAKELGAINTNFVTPNGLHDENHYTTAYDLALISSYAIKNDTFKQIVSTQYYTIPWENHQWDRVVKNKNKILWQYEGGIGIKTGYTKKAGKCLVSAAEHNGMEIVCVVLNCPDFFRDSMELMDEAYENYDRIPLYLTDSYIGTISVDDGIEKSFDVYVEDDITLTLTRQESERIQCVVDLPKSIKAPVFADTLAGTIEIWLDGQKICSQQLYAHASIPEDTYGYHLQRILSKMLG
ncbi:MAG: D-alanyl-D-alanine carboxypeptidase family protein [Christensenellales bacterium]